MARLAKLMLLGVTITLLHGCELGADELQVDVAGSGNAFSLASLQSLDAGFARSFTVTGTDAGGTALTGTFSIQNLPATTFNGQPATPRQRTLTVTDTGTSAFTNTQEILYLATGFQVLGSSDPLTGVTCLPTGTLPPLPASADIGQSGTLGSLVCSDGTQRLLSWRMDGTTGGRAVAMLITSSSDASGVPFTVTQDGFVIDNAGTILGVVLTLLDLRTGISTTLQSSAI